MSWYAVILGGGSGRRMQSDVNKVFLPLRGVPAIIRAIAPFTGLCAGAVVVAAQGEGEFMRGLLQRYGMDRFVRAVVPGGSERQHSVANGLSALPADADYVLIHDGARALVTEDVIRRAMDSALAHGSGIASVPVVDTIKRADGDGLVLETLNRSQLYAMQTPQAFLTSLLLRAYEQARADGFLGTDDASLLEHAGLPVYLSQGDRENLKLTTPADLSVAQVILAARLEKENAL